MFGNKNKTADELLKLFSALSDEEKQKFLGAVNGKDVEDTVPDGELKAEDEEQPTPTAEETEESAEEPATPTVEETEDAPTEETPSEDTPVEGAPTEDAPAEDATPDTDTQAQDSFAEVLEGFGARLSSIEESIKGLEELKEQMEKYTQAQADKFGYNGTVPGGKTEFKEMSAAEMKNKILNGEI